MPQRQLIPDVIGHQQPLTCSLDTTVRQATQKMTARKVSAILITDPQQRLLGLFTERDLAERVVASGLDPQTTSVSEVMSKKVDSLPPHATASDALNLMETKHYRHLPVVAEGKILGIVSIRNLFAVRTALLEEEIQHLGNYVGGNYSVASQGKYSRQ